MSKSNITVLVNGKRPRKAVTPPAEQPATMLMELVLVFTVDGQPAFNTPFRCEVPKPTDDQVAQLQLKLDGRVLLQLLEPHLGPSKLWIPGA